MNNFAAESVVVHFLTYPAASLTVRDPVVAESP